MIRVIFLDFDGVLHPAGGPPGETLVFSWVPVLAEELDAFPAVNLVVHSSWVEKFDIDYIREFLAPLDQRVLGVVDKGPKRQSILGFVRDHPEIADWLVIDDAPAELGVDFPGQILACDPRSGISNPETRRQLRAWLDRPPTTGDQHGEC